MLCIFINILIPQKLVKNRWKRPRTGKKSTFLYCIVLKIIKLKQLLGIRVLFHHTRLRWVFASYCSECFYMSRLTLFNEINNYTVSDDSIRMKLLCNTDKFSMKFISNWLFFTAKLIYWTKHTVFFLILLNKFSFLKNDCLVWCQWNKFSGDFIWVLFVK